MKRNETGLGKSNDKGKAVRDEIRAAELQYDMHRTKGENRGYATHHNGTDVPHDGWAGWLEREISTHDEQQDEALRTRPSPNWPDNLLEAIAGQGRQAAAKHAGMPEGCIDFRPPPGTVWPAKAPTSMCFSPECLDGIDQSEPATQPSEPLVEQQDIHSEPTHVGTIDARFEDGDGL